MNRIASIVRARPALGMAVATALSRASGLVRIVVLAAALGVTRLGDAYNTANTVPNMLFQFVAGGLTTAGLVPILVGTTDDRERGVAASVLLTALCGIALLGAVVLAVFARPTMSALMAGAAGRPDHAQAVDQGATWLRIFAPQVVFYAISVGAVGIMTARRRLTLGAVAPVLTNVITIAGAWLFLNVSRGGTDLETISSPATAVLGWSTTAGVAAMALVQLWGARRIESGLGARLDLRHPVLRRMGRLGRWMLLYVAVNQIGLAIVVALSSRVPGGVSAYQWAFILMQLPYAIVGVSVYSAAYARMSVAAIRSKREIADEAAAAAWGANVWLLPAAAGLVLTARPVAVVLVGPEGAGLVSAALIGFAVSLLPFSLFQLLTRVAYASGDARTPALVNVAVNVVMVVVDVAVVLTVSDGPAMLTGLALGHAASYVAGSALLAQRLNIVRVLSPGSQPSPDLRIALTATLGMVLAVMLLPRHRLADGRGTAAVEVIGSVVVGGAAYAFARFFLGRIGGRRTSSTGGEGSER